MQTR